MFYNLLKKDCTTFTSSVTVFNENTVTTEGIQITLYFLMILYLLLDIVAFMKTIIAMHK